MKWSELSELEVGSIIEAGELLPAVTAIKPCHKIAQKEVEHTEDGTFVRKMLVESFFMDILLVRLEGCPALVDDKIVWKQVK